MQDVNLRILLPALVLAATLCVDHWLGRTVAGVTAGLLLVLGVGMIFVGVRRMQRWH